MVKNKKIYALIMASVFGVLVASTGVSAQAAVNTNDENYSYTLDIKECDEVVWGNDADYNWSSDKECTINNVSFKMNNDDTVYLSSASLYSDESLSIPSKIKVEGKYYSVTSIGNGAFCFNSKLTSVTIPSSVTSIGQHAFLYCENITSIEIPNGVTSIGNSAFYGCRSLTDITIPSSITKIDESTFNGCSSLTSITIPGNVKSIGKSAFNCCYGLTSVTISSGVTSIGDWAFTWCTSLKTVTIPSSVTSIGREAFQQCHIDTIWGNANQLHDLGLYNGSYYNFRVGQIIEPNEEV